MPANLHVMHLAGSYVRQHQYATCGMWECLLLPQVALYGSAPSMEAIPVKERYTAAVACIAEGVAARKPALISTAHRYLTSCQEAAPALGCVSCATESKHTTASPNMEGMSAAPWRRRPLERVSPADRVCEGASPQAEKSILVLGDRARK